MIGDLFQAFTKVDIMLGGDLLEMSVKQNQISLILKSKHISFDYIRESLLKFSCDDRKSILTATPDGKIYIIFEETSNIKEEHWFYPFVETIKKMAEEVCTCPALEYIIAENYIKCFLDKPGLKGEDLRKYEDILGAVYTLELHPQRPYLLFVNEDYVFEGEME